MRTVAIVQARMGSTRLPGKVLLDIGGQPMLTRVLRRLSRATLDEIVVATVAEDASEPIIDLCQKLGVGTYTGSELDVLDRYYQAARKNGADRIVRIMSDCPVIDPDVVNETIATFTTSNVDYASNTVTRTYPRGLDTEIMSFSTLERAWQEANQNYERVHVTPYIYEHPTSFRIREILHPSDQSHYRWTVDTPEDLRLLRKIYAHFGNSDIFSWHDIVLLMKQQPHLYSVNAAIKHKHLQEG